MFGIMPPPTLTSHVINVRELLGGDTGDFLRLKKTLPTQGFEVSIVLAEIFIQDFLRRQTYL